MGVKASGATLEIQLVADVARLQRDMKAMQATVRAPPMACVLVSRKIGGTSGQVGDGDGGNGAIECPRGCRAEVCGAVGRQRADCRCWK